MSNKYLFLLWVLTLLIGPFIYGLYKAYNDIENQVIGLVEIYPVTVIFSLVFSVPTFGLIYFINWLSTKVKIKNILKKPVIIMIAMSGMIISLDYLGGTMTPGLKFGYSVAILLSFILTEFIQRLIQRQRRTN